MMGIELSYRWDRQVMEAVHRQGHKKFIDEAITRAALGENIDQVERYWY